MYIAYIFGQDAELKLQIEELQDVSVNTKLNAVGTGTCNYRSDAVDWLSVFSKLSDTAYLLVKLVKQYPTGEEYPAMEGLLAGFDGDTDFKRMAIKTFNHLLERRQIQVDIPCSENVPIRNVLVAVVDHINSVFDTRIVVDCSTDDTIGDAKTYTYGQSVMQIVKDLAKSSYDFDLVPNRPLKAGDNSDFYLTLKFGTAIGADLSETTIFEDDINDISSKNISVKGTLDFTNFANGVSAKSGANFAHYESLADIAERGIRIETTLTPNGDVSSTVILGLAERLNPQVKLDITPDELGDEFFSYNVGDIISVYIYHNDPLLDFDGTMKIIEKKLDDGDAETKTIKIGTTFDASEDDDPTQQNKQLRDRVKNLEVKTL